MSSARRLAGVQRLQGRRAVPVGTLQDAPAKQGGLARAVLADADARQRQQRPCRAWCRPGRVLSAWL
ncbi:hypothetical protein ACE0DR_19170 [Azotobacter sp. CWF10]